MSVLPDITVLIPVYNGAKYLRQALESILQQDYSNFELLIIDDGSTDNSPNIIQAIADPRIRYIHQENAGIISAMNHGLAEARGRYIARMDQDDISLPHRLRKQRAFMLAHPNIMVLGSNYRLMDTAGHITSKPAYHRNLRGLQFTWSMLWRNPFAHPATMYHRAAALTVGGYPNLPYSEDYGLWIAIAKKAPLATSLSVDVYLRKHEQSMTARNEQTSIEASMQQSKHELERYLAVPTDAQKLTPIFFPKTRVFTTQEYLQAIDVYLETAKKFMELHVHDPECAKLRQLHATQLYDLSRRWKHDAKAARHARKNAQLHDRFVALKYVWSIVHPGLV